MIHLLKVNSLIIILAIMAAFPNSSQAGSGIQMTQSHATTDDSYLGFTHHSPSFGFGLAVNYYNTPGYSTKGILGQLLYFGYNFGAYDKTSFGIGPIFLRYTNLSAAREDYLAGVYLGADHNLDDHLP